MKSLPQHEFLIAEVTAPAPDCVGFFVRIDRDANPQARIKFVPMKTGRNRHVSSKVPEAVLRPFDYANSRDRITIFKDKECALKWGDNIKIFGPADAGSNGPQWLCRTLTFKDRGTAPTVLELASCAAAVSNVGNKYDTVTTMCFWNAFWVYNLLREITTRRHEAVSTVEDSIKEGYHGTYRGVTVLNEGSFVAASSLGKTPVVCSPPEDRIKTLFPPDDDAFVTKCQGDGRSEAPEILSKGAVPATEDQVCRI